MIKQRNISPCISHAGKMGNFIQGKYKGHTLSAANGTAYHSTLEMTPGQSIIRQYSWYDVLFHGAIMFVS
jgi:hypothetical protein